MIKRIPGTRDILPEETPKWQEIEAIARKIFSFYNYKEVRPPLIEEEALFNRSLGESAEIVQKQMFLLKEGYTLRPEGTGPTVRLYIENDLDKTVGLAKFYYTGAMFRRERPQKGRLRQFHHIGCEVIGSQDPTIDVEVISLADNLLKSFSIGNYKIKLNSLGCPEDKKKLTKKLTLALKPKLNRLCPDCKVRFKKNVLRILDCKNENCIEVVRGLEINDAHLCDECKNHFTQVKEGLDALGVNYEVSPYLVRGLDYYTRTIFEIVHKDLGAQDALGAGGRYDNLVQELGGPAVGAIGFALGMERLLLVIDPKAPAVSKNLVYIISLGEEARRQNIKLLDELRKNGIAADTDYENKSLKGAMRRANDLKANHVLIIGEDELKKNLVTLKDMSSGEQKQVNRAELLKELKR